MLLINWKGGVGGLNSLSGERMRQLTGGKFFQFEFINKNSYRKFIIGERFLRRAILLISHNMLEKVY